MGFGPAGLVLEPLPSLITGGGSIGYTLSLRSHASSLDLDWNLTTDLTVVDWRGKPLTRPKRKRRHVGVISRNAKVAVLFRVSGEPAFYRLITTFKDKRDEKLGAYGFYFRVVPATGGVRLVLDANSYRPGDTILGRVDNLGTETVRYGTAFAIERPEGAGWAIAPGSPDGPWTLQSFGTPAGQAGKICTTFRIPQHMRPGRYRMSKRFETRSMRFSNAISIAAEFSVLP